LAVVAAIFTGVVFPVVVHFIEEQPQETANLVLKFLHVALKFLLDLSEQTWLRVTALVLAGFVAGLWVDWLLRRLDRSRAEARENLGIEMTNLANEIDNALALVDRFRLPDFSPRLMSAFIKATKVGLWTPDLRMNPNDIVYYLRHVGTFLGEGHFAEAKQAAQAIAENAKRAKSH
jgi:hypothetical protein